MKKAIPYLVLLSCLGSFASVFITIINAVENIKNQHHEK